MREILYDMTHNSIWGIIALTSSGLYILYFASYCILSLLRKKCYKLHNSGKLRRFLIIIKPNDILFFIVCGVVIISLIMFFLFDWRVERHKYDYIRTDLGKQTDLEILFKKEVYEEYEENVFESKEYMERLHISEENPMMEITKENIEDRKELFESIYQTGSTESGNGKVYNKIITSVLQKIRNVVSNKKSVTLDEYIKEYEKWNLLYNYYGLSSDLYQSSRSAKDALVKWDSSASEEEMLEIAGDAIYKSEHFLEYEDRNIHKEGESIIIGIKDIAFSNGKVYSQLYTKFQEKEEMKKYDKELLVNAYVSMFYAEKNISEEDADYAKINYYIGDICEKMLDEISNEDEFYKETAKEALEHYTTASESLEMNAGYYNQELNMQQNIENGKNKLEELLDNIEKE